MDVITGWTLFGALTLAVGVLAARWLILPVASSTWGETERRRCQETIARAGSFASALLVMGVLLYFVRQLREFRDPFVPWSHDALLLLQGTTWGRTWSWAAVGSVLAVVTFRLAICGRTVGWWLATPTVLAMAAFPGSTGHAAGPGALRPLALIADTIHVWAAGAWIGGLAVVLWIELAERVRGHGGSPSILADLVPAFSPVAMVSVGLLVLTGGFAAWLHLPAFQALWTTRYGLLLALKLALAAILILLGALNARVFAPRLGSVVGARALRRTAMAELLIAQVVLVVTAILVRTAPM